MNRKTKVALLVGIPILIGGYLIYRQFRKSKTKPLNLDEKQNQISEVITEIKNTPSQPPKKGCTFPIQKGSYDCDWVLKLQKSLNSFPYAFKNSPLKEDGDFGTKTEQALSDVTYQMYGFQDANSGYKDVYDEATFNKIVNDIQNTIAKAISDYNDEMAAQNPYVTAPPSTPPTSSTGVFNPNNPFNPFGF